MKPLGWQIILLLLYSTQLAFAQSFKFETLTTRNGLSSNEITCIYEDTQHFLWIGTREGLNRFDGRKFEIFRSDPNNPNSLSGNFIIDVLQDKQSIYWIATKDGGLTRYDAHAPAGQQFRQFKNNPKDVASLATNRLNCLYDWDENYLLIGAEVYPGIFLNKKTFAFSYWNYPAPFHPNTGNPAPASGLNWIHHISSNKQGEVYVSTLLNGQLFKASKQNGAIQMLHDTSGDVLSINHFLIDDSTLWLCSWNPGLFVQSNSFQPTAKKIAFVDDHFMCVANLDNQHVIAGTRASGLYVINKTSGATTYYRKNILQPHALPSNKINCLLTDSRGIVWIGTSGGLAKFDKQTWLFDEKEFTGPETDCTILHCHRFDDGSVAVNTSKGMFLSDAGQQKFRQVNFSHHAKQMAPDYILKTGEQKYLLGTENGFFEWTAGTNRLKELKVMQKGHPYGEFYNQGVYQVKQMLPDTVHGEAGVWLAVLGYGIQFYHTGNFQFDIYQYDREEPKSIASNLTRRLAKDKQGNIWVATSAGLYKWSASNRFGENNFESFLHEPGNKNSLPNNDVTDIWCDERNHIWVTTNGEGLCEWDGQKFTCYIPDNPVSSRSFFGIYGDHQNRLWIITRNGLEVFDRQTKKFFHLDINDGNSNTTLAPNFSNETNGWVSFAAGNRIYSFQPDAMKFNASFPSLHLTGMDVFGKSYLQEATDGIVHLTSKERFVNFTVSALQFISPQSVRFQYKLQELEDNWNNSEDGEIKYTNLPWGKFKLLVRVTNPSGQFGGETKLAEFIIATPFYATWWFIALCVLVTAAIVYGIYQYRINQLLAMQKVRNKIARDLHDDIGSTLGSISFFSEAAKQQMQQSNTANVEKMLLKIGDTSREMVDNMSDIVWSVNPNNDSVKRLIERMRVFADDLMASAEIQLHFKYEEGLEDMKLSMEQRKNIFLIFKETIYNSIKYSGCKNLFIELKKGSKGLVLSISDDGKGFDVNNYQSKNGNGIRNMRHRAEEISAKLNINSSEKGTITQLYI